MGRQAAPGLHLDVVKGDKLVEKLIIDEKKYYLFGRNPDACDFTIDHQSCSRVHAALVYHRHLKRVFLIDLNSTHGTFLGRIRLEAHKPQQVPIDSTMSKPGEDEELKGLLGLPEEETELENLTEFNTAHNKRISTLTIEEGNLDIQRPKRKRRNSRVTFSDEEEIINPEDVDPSVGRFRNMVQTAVVPIKKKKVEVHGGLGSEDGAARRTQNVPFGMGGLYGDLPPPARKPTPTPPRARAEPPSWGAAPALPQPRPEVDLSPSTAQPPVTLAPAPPPDPTPGGPQRAAKEEVRQGGVAGQAPPPPC
ncbi:hypothetical protein ANANG_G00183290 [Anguilla anguilla]|uniref:FHA domain-containing protein n=1 Tax=Anguilla anguilla TaxID=7936 RepID=A0A9D3M8T5_ANGAN|nr:hypothetical protein ANANG_G00183290 [Anguilla anguilla]